MVALERSTEKQSPLDDVDYRLIGLLAQDGRLPYRDLARHVSLSETRTRQRVLRLIEQGYIAIAAITDPLKLGMGVMAAIGVRVSGQLAEIATAIAREDQVTWVAVTAGTYDIMVEVACRDNSALLEIVEKLRSLGGVQHTDSFIYLKVQKQLYTGGPGVMNVRPARPLRARPGGKASKQDTVDDVPTTTPATAARPGAMARQ